MKTRREQRGTHLILRGVLLRRPQHNLRVVFVLLHYTGYGNGLRVEWRHVWHASGGAGGQDRRGIPRASACGGALR